MSNLTDSHAELLAEIANNAGASVSAKTDSPAKIIGAWYAATVGGANPYLTMSVAAMLAAVRNDVVGGSKSHLTTDVEELLADIGGVSDLTSDVGEILDAIMEGGATPADYRDGFDAGTSVAAEGADFSTGYFTVDGGVTSTKTFTALTSGTHRVDFYISIRDTQTFADSIHSTFVYLLPTASSAVSSNSITTFAFGRDTTGSPAATATEFEPTYANASTFVSLPPNTWPRGPQWYKLSVVLAFATKKFDIYVNDILWVRDITWRNAVAADFSRIVIINSAGVNPVFFDNFVVTTNWTLPAETLMVTDTFTTNAGEIEATSPTSSRSLHTQPWLIPDDTTRGAFTRGASGLVPDATLPCSALIRCGPEGIFETDWTAAPSGVIYMGMSFRVWDGTGLSGTYNYRYNAGAAAGQKIALILGTGNQVAADPTGVTISASGTYTLKAELRGIYGWFSINNVLQFGGPVYVGNRGLLIEDHAGPVHFSNLGALTNFCTAFRWTGRAPAEQIQATVGANTYRIEPGSIKELYNSNLTLNQRNLFWSRGIQYGHNATADMGNYICAQSRLANSTNVQIIRQRSVAMREDDILGLSECYVTLLRRGPWIADRTTYYSDATSNHAPDHDFRPDLWSRTYRYVTNTGASSTKTIAIGQDWTTDVAESTALPKAFQMITSSGGNTMRFNAAFRNVENYTAGTGSYVASKRMGAGDPLSIAFTKTGSAMTYGTGYEVARCYLLETGSLAASDTVLTDWRDDIKTPPVPATFLVGSLKTDAAGDIDADGFNERYGWNEITCAGGAASFTHVKGTPNKRHQPAFRLNSYSGPRTVTIAGVPGVAGTDYVLDDLGDATAILQLLTDRTADTAIVIA